MEEKIYYPAIFFKDIVEYYGGNESIIEGKMYHNIECFKENKLNEIKNLVEDCILIKDDGSELAGKKLLKEFEKIQLNEKETKKIKKYNRILGKIKAMNQINSTVADSFLSLIQRHAEAEGKTGYSDTSISRYMNPGKNSLNEEKYNDIIEYLIEPDAQGDYSGLVNHMLDAMSSDKYQKLQQETLVSIKNTLSREDFSGNHILRIFRLLERNSYGFDSQMYNGEAEERPISKVNKDFKLKENILNALKNIWGEIETESVGITMEEKYRISVEVSQELLIDHKFYQKIIRENIENFKGYQALIFYRLYNKIFYYMDEHGSADAETDDLRKAFAFYAFCILQRAIEHTEILLHPAAKLKVPVFIGNGVMVGKQCKIEEECVLGTNVCLYPFNIYNTDLKGQDVYIDVGRRSIFCKNTKILGSIRIGSECMLDKPILIGDSIENKTYVSMNKMQKTNTKIRENIMAEGIL